MYTRPRSTLVRDAGSTIFMAMQRNAALLAASVLALTGCATTGAPVATASGTPPAIPGCPLPAEGPRFSISVTDHGGPAVHMELRDSIAHAIAEVWGEDVPRTVRDWPRYIQVLRELNARVPLPPFHTQKKWRVRESDSAVVLLSYGRGTVPELDIPEQGLRREFKGWLLSAIGRAIGGTVSGRWISAPMPLQVPGASDTVITLEVRFGWSPRPGAAVAAFARQEREARGRPNNRGPNYPAQYRQQNIEGEVMVGFIVSLEGEVDPSSIRLISSDGDLFTSSVQYALPGMRFDPLVVECVAWPRAGAQPFTFYLRR